MRKRHKKKALKRFLEDIQLSFKLTDAMKMVYEIAEATTLSPEEVIGEASSRSEKSGRAVLVELDNYYLRTFRLTPGGVGYAMAGVVAAMKGPIPVSGYMVKECVEIGKAFAIGLREGIKEGIEGKDRKEEAGN